MSHTLAAPGMTKLLQRAHAGDARAERDVLATLQPLLRSIAVRHMRRHRHLSIWQPTAVVDEAWLRVMAQRQHAWQDRHHFLRIASRMIYRIVVDWARRESAAKRNAGPMAELPTDGGCAASGLSADDLLDLHAALERLGALAPRLVHLVRMRFFGGCRMADIADALHVSQATVEADWQLARTLLHEMLDPSERTVNNRRRSSR
jgi:RNA polymerase sigma-70 factor (ECF subfamily)